MTIISKQHIIPEHSETVTEYVAEDGKVFDSRVACELYEEHQRIQNHRVYRSAIRNIRDFSGGGFYTLYFFIDKTDYDFFVEANNINTELDSVQTWEEGGSGFWLHQWVSHGGGTGRDILVNLEHYISTTDKAWADWRDNVLWVIDRKIKEMANDEG